MADIWLEYRYPYFLILIVSRREIFRNRLIWERGKSSGLHSRLPVVIKSRKDRLPVHAYLFPVRIFRHRRYSYKLNSVNGKREEMWSVWNTCANNTYLFPVWLDTLSCIIIVQTEVGIWRPVIPVRKLGHSVSATTLTSATLVVAASHGVFFWRKKSYWIGRTYACCCNDCYYRASSINHWPRLLISLT